MDTETARSIVSKADWFSYDKLSGLRLDGYFDTRELEAFAWLMLADDDALEALSNAKVEADEAWLKAALAEAKQGKP